MARGTAAVRGYILKWAIFLPCAAGLIAVTYALGRFIDAPWDFELLRLLNPDAYVPVMDELIILVTDFSTYLVVVLSIVWVAAYRWSRDKEARRVRMAKLFHILAVVLGAYHLMGVWVQGMPSVWWGEYRYDLVFIPLGAIFLLAFWKGGDLFTKTESEERAKLYRLFWLCLLTVVFTNFLGEDWIKEAIGRHRPLHSAYAPWNECLRTLADETVRGHYSYISGHASSFFAIMTPVFWAVRNPWLRGGALGWASLHAYTRVYTAVHFPYCVLMGSLLGFFMGTLVFHVFWTGPRLGEGSPEAAPGTPTCDRA